jgi:hypothetical protein
MAALGHELHETGLLKGWTMIIGVVAWTPRPILPIPGVPCVRIDDARELMSFFNFAGELALDWCCDKDGAVPVGFKRCDAEGLGEMTLAPRAEGVMFVERVTPAGAVKMGHATLCAGDMIDVPAQVVFARSARLTGFVANPEDKVWVPWGA